MDRIKHIGVIATGLIVAGISGFSFMIMYMVSVFLMYVLTGAGFFTTQKAQEVGYSSPDGSNFYVPTSTAPTGPSAMEQLLHIFATISFFDMIFVTLVIMIIAFIIGTVIAILYNIVATYTGGLEIELEPYEPLNTRHANPTRANAYSRPIERDYRPDTYSRPNERDYRTNDGYSMDDQYFSR